MIRTATEDDVDAVVRLGEAFHREYPLGMLFAYDHDYVRAAVRGLLDQVGATIIIADHRTRVVGMIAGCTTSTLFNPRACIASEIAWYVQPEYRHTTYGVRLLHALETWAQATGAAYLSMYTHAARPWVADIYVRRGYSLLETHYGKVLHQDVKEVCG